MRKVYFIGALESEEKEKTRRHQGFSFRLW